MEKETKTRIVCMNCLHSKIADKVSDDPKNTRLITLWSCDRCCEESDEINFYDNQMRQLDIEE
jgi:hypothetical protein